jgi:hypothetical protein
LRTYLAKHNREMTKEKLIHTFDLQTERLLVLAQERSRQIKTYLVETGGIPGERISLSPEQIIDSSEGDHARTTLHLTAR